MLSQQAAPPPEAGPLFSHISFAGRACVIAAVSGGGDSLALLFLLHDHLKDMPGAPALMAVTVDHGLRPEAAEEARAVGRLCTAHGIAHRVLAWHGPKPATGISAAAREARLRLLAEAADEAGTDLVFTGHTADDQAETLAMRMARGEGRGLAGIAPATLLDSRFWLLRPLLSTRREALRSYLEARGIAWIEDPTNTDRRFERARTRQALSENDVARLNAVAHDAAGEREAIGEKAAAFMAEAARLVAPGLLRLSRPGLEEVEHDVALYTLRILLAVAGGRPHLPDEARTAAILARVHGNGFRDTLSRAVLAARRQDIYLYRERRHLPAESLADGLVWDGRHRLSLRAGEGLSIAPFGPANAREAALQEPSVPAGLLRAALAAEPALWSGHRCLGLARERQEVSLQPVAGPWARLLPSFDLAPARAVLYLLGAASLPVPPWRGHNDKVG